MLFRSEELDRTGRRRTCLEVSDVQILARLLEERGEEYKILSDARAELYGKTELSGLFTALGERGCRVFSVKESEESLESFYMNLIGGERDE